MFRLFSLENVLTVLIMIISLLCCSPTVLIQSLRSGRPFAHRRPCGAESKSTRCAQVQGFNLGALICAAMFFYLPAKDFRRQHTHTKCMKMVIYIINCTCILCAGPVCGQFFYEPNLCRSLVSRG